MMDKSNYQFTSLSKNTIEKLTTKYDLDNNKLEMINWSVNQVFMCISAVICITKYTSPNNQQVTIHNESYKTIRTFYITYQLGSHTELYKGIPPLLSVLRSPVSHLVLVWALLG